MAKQIVAHIAVLLAIVVSASAGSFQLASQNAVFGGELAPSVSGYFSKGKGVSTFFLVGEKYAEGYLSFGRSMTIAGTFVAADAGLGVEQTQDGFGRMIAASAFAKKGSVSLLGIVENGTGLWYKSYLKWQVVPQISLGLLAQRYAGVGPRIDFRIPRTPVTLWGAVLRDQELGRSGGIVAVTSSF